MTTNTALLFIATVLGIAWFVTRPSSEEEQRETIAPKDQTSMQILDLLQRAARGEKMVSQFCPEGQVRVPSGILCAVGPCPEQWKCIPLEELPLKPHSQAVA